MGRRKGGELGQIVDRVLQRLGDGLGLAEAFSDQETLGRGVDEALRSGLRLLLELRAEDLAGDGVDPHARHEALGVRVGLVGDDQVGHSCHGLRFEALASE